jgi:hypothetical protein
LPPGSELKLTSIRKRSILTLQTTEMESTLEQEQNTRTERKKREAKERILAATEHFFIAENSYNETTMREIADRADVGIGSVYNHFKTWTVHSRGLMLRAPCVWLVLLSSKDIPPRGGHPCFWLMLPTIRRIADFHR